LTERDLDLLVFIASHRFVHARHVTEWIGADRAVAYRRLSGLSVHGLVHYERIFHAEPGVFQITNGGLAVCNSPLPRPKVDLRTYRHDAGTVDLWLQARAGAFGPVGRLLTEREMRHHDLAPEPVDGVPFGFRIGGYDRAGRPRVHFPDMLTIAPALGRVALELELSLKGERRLEEILLGYALDDRINQVVYLADQPHVHRTLTELIARLNLAERVSCRYCPGWENRHEMDRFTHRCQEPKARR
jgi:hypothetical protein